MAQAASEFSAFPVPDYRFDQKNDVFKRVWWEEELKPLAQRYYMDVHYQDRPGWRKEDFALRNGAWAVEWSFGFGNSHGNTGMFAWDGVSWKIQHYIDEGGPVQKDPVQMSALVKKAALLYGADLVGIGPVHPNWVYSHEFDLTNMEHRPLELPEGCTNAVALALEMDYDGIQAAPTPLASAAVGVGYSRMAFVANLVAAFIRGLGYKAVPSGNDTALSVPLAMAAGLGEAGRMGIMITPEFGPRVRLAKVFTDLPLAPDGFRPFGVREFCSTCGLCAQHCPARAIPAGDPTDRGPNISSHSGVRKWYVDGLKCYTYWAQNRMDCGVCLRVCPFNKRPGLLHSAVRAVVKRTSVLNRAFVRADVALGYGRMLTPARYYGPDILGGAKAAGRLREREPGR
jgi:epoxyqueuosine reductase